MVVGLGLRASLDLDLVGRPTPSLRADWAIVALLVGSTGGVVQARSRLAAVANPGLSGLLVAAWFVLIDAPGWSRSASGCSTSAKGTGASGRARRCASCR